MDQNTPRETPREDVTAKPLKPARVALNVLALCFALSVLGRDGVPTYFRGKIIAGAGHIIDSDTRDYPMAIDSGEMNVEWDSNRRVLVAPFKLFSGANRVTLLAHATRAKRRGAGRAAFCQAKA